MQIIEKAKAFFSEEDNFVGLVIFSVCVVCLILGFFFNQ